MSFKLHHSDNGNGVFLGRILPPGTQASASIKLDTSHPFYIVERSIELANQEYLELFRLGLLSELRSMGPEVAAYYQAISRRLSAITSYEASLHENGLKYVILIEGNSRHGDPVMLEFIVRREGEEYRIEDISTRIQE